MTTFKKHHGRRLLILAAFLRTLPPRKFDLRSWVKRGDPVNHPCDTVACACGWGASIPSFRRAGLHLRRDVEARLGVFYSPRGARAPGAGWWAVRQFFGLDLAAQSPRDEARYLFDATYYPRGRRGPKSVAKRIEAFVRDHYPDLEA